MPGIYIQCDVCKVSFGGDQGYNKTNWDRGYHWSNKDGLRSEARAKGWAGPMLSAVDRITPGLNDDIPDLCPECSGSKQQQIVLDQDNQ